MPWLALEVLAGVLDCDRHGQAAVALDEKRQTAGDVAQLVNMSPEPKPAETCDEGSRWSRLEIV